MAERVLKLTSFLAAASLAVETKQWSRAERYAQWAVRCRPGSSRAHESLGDYYAAVGDRPGALAAYEGALRLDPKSESVRVKLAKAGMAAPHGER